MIDWDRVRDLRDEIGAEDFPEVVDLFLEETGEVVDRLRTRMGGPGLQEDLHFLKGSLLSLGFTAVSALCEAGERKSAAGQPETVDIAAIVRGFDTARACFLRELATRIGP